MRPDSAEREDTQRKEPSLFDRLEAHTLAGARADLARARERHAALARYATPESVVEALRYHGPRRGSPKAALMMALLVEAKAGARSLAEVLLRGFEPKLTPLLRQAAESTVDDPAVLEAMVAAAFMEGIAAYRPDASGDPSRFLMSETRRHLAVAVRDLNDGEPPAAPAESPPPELHSLAGRWADPPLETGGPVASSRDPGGFTDAASELLVRIVDGRLPEAKLVVIEATVVHDETVMEYVDRCYAHVEPRARQRVYQHVVGQRCRTLGFLHRALWAWRKDPRGWAVW